MKTLKEIRASFWDCHDHLASQYRVKYRQNDYPCDTRVAFCDWVDYLVKSGQITEKLANRATL